MSQLIESIRLNDGQFNNLKYHEQRMDCSLKELYNIDGRSDLNHFFRSIEYPRKGLYKCRLLYDNQSKITEFVPYTFKRVKSLKLIVDNDILSLALRYKLNIFSWLSSCSLKYCN